MLYAQLVVLALAAIMPAAAGCGGSSKAGTSATQTGTPAATSTPAPAPSTPVVSAKVKLASGKPLARSAWIARGDEVCGRLIAELASIKVKATKELPRVLPQAVAYERAAVAQLAKLVPPSSKTGDWQTLLNDTMQFSEYSMQLVGSARLGDAITRSPLSALTRALRERIVKIARHDGFRECSLAL